MPSMLTFGGDTRLAPTVAAAASESWLSLGRGLLELGPAGEGTLATPAPPSPLSLASSELDES